MQNPECFYLNFQVETGLLACSHALAHGLSRCHCQSPSRYHCAMRTVNTEENEILDTWVVKIGITSRSTNILKKNS